MTTLADLERVERELRARAKKLHAHGYYSESAKEEQMADTIAAYIASAKAASQPEAAPAQNSEAVTTGWRPIETAPKDGTRILLATDNPHGDPVWTGLWADGWVASYGKVTLPIIGWMPLPEPPKENDTKGSPNPEGLSDV